MDELVIKYVGQFNEAKDERRAAAVFKTAALTENGQFLRRLWIDLAAGSARSNLFRQGYDINAPGSLFMDWVVLFNLITESATGLLRIFDRFRRMAALNAAQAVVTLGLTLVVFISYHWMPALVNFNGQALSPVDGGLSWYIWPENWSVPWVWLIWLRPRRAAPGGAGWWRVSFGALRGAGQGTGAFRHISRT